MYPRTPRRVAIAIAALGLTTVYGRVVRDSSLVTWRAVAKDGFTLPASQATVRPSSVRVASGETADFELTPDAPGELRLEFGTPVRGGGFQIQAVVPLHVAKP